MWKKSASLVNIWRWQILTLDCRLPTLYCWILFIVNFYCQPFWSNNVDPLMPIFFCRPFYSRLLIVYFLLSTVYCRLFTVETYCRLLLSTLLFSTLYYRFLLLSFIVDSLLPILIVDFYCRIFTDDSLLSILTIDSLLSTYILFILVNFKTTKFRG